MLLLVLLLLFTSCSEEPSTGKVMNLLSEGWKGVAESLLVEETRLFTGEGRKAYLVRYTLLPTEEVKAYLKAEKVPLPGRLPPAFSCLRSYCKEACPLTALFVFKETEKGWVLSEEESFLCGLK